MSINNQDWIIMQKQSAGIKFKIQTNCHIQDRSQILMLINPSLLNNRNKNKSPLSHGHNNAPSIPILNNLNSNMNMNINVPRSPAHIMQQNNNTLFTHTFANNININPNKPKAPNAIINGPNIPGFGAMIKKNSQGAQLDLQCDQVLVNNKKQSMPQLDFICNQSLIPFRNGVGAKNSQKPLLSDRRLQERKQSQNLLNPIGQPQSQSPVPLSPHSHMAIMTKGNKVHNMIDLKCNQELFEKFDKQKQKENSGANNRMELEEIFRRTRGALEAYQKRFLQMADKINQLQSQNEMLKMQKHRK